MCCSTDCAPGSTMVEHSTHNPKVKGLNPALAPGEREWQKVLVDKQLMPKLTKSKLLVAMTEKVN